MHVRACSTYTTRGGRLSRIQQVMKHPNWSVRKPPDNDVALGLMDRPVRFTHSCHAVDIPNHAMFPPFNDVWVAGWGGSRPDGIVEERGISMQVYYAHVLARPVCNVQTTRFGIIITPNFICLEQKGRRAPCTGDTGAPAVSDGILWGLASWGIRKKCGTERYPAVFSYIGSEGNLFFITNASRYLMSEERVYPYLDRFSIKDMPFEEEKTNVTKIGPSILKLKKKPEESEAPDIIKIPV